MMIKRRGRTKHEKKTQLKLELRRADVVYGYIVIFEVYGIETIKKILIECKSIEPFLFFPF